jgi:hypothetical protein
MRKPTACGVQEGRRTSLGACATSSPRDAAEARAPAAPRRDGRRRRHQLALRSPARERGEDTSAFETDRRERLVHLLEELVDEGSVPAGFSNRSHFSKKLLIRRGVGADISGGLAAMAAFGGVAKMIWTVALKCKRRHFFRRPSSPASSRCRRPNSAAKHPSALSRNVRRVAPARGQYNAKHRP